MVIVALLKFSNRLPIAARGSLLCVAVNKKPLMLNQFYTALFFCLSSLSATAQCYEPATLESRMGEATVAVVGHVVSSEPFYNNFGEIYTKHVLAIDRTLAVEYASNPASEIEFFTIGGVINEERLVVSPSPKKMNNADGLFLLTEYTGNRVTSDTRMFRLATVRKSYLAYNKQTGQFSDGSVVLGNLLDVERMVLDAFGTGFAMVSERSFSPEPIVAGRMMPTIFSITPLSVSAGIGEVITIEGSGFGGPAGRVFFDSPDDGTGGAFTEVEDSEIISWGNRRIRVRVVSGAGSGSISLLTAIGQEVESDQQINVDFAISNLNPNDGEAVTPRLIDDEADGDGGYRFYVSNSSANNGLSLAEEDAAFDALSRAVETWQTTGDFNIALQGTTDVQVPSRDDDVNIISFGSDAFDFDVELEAGTVGIAYSYYSSCGSSEFEVTGFDILFRRPGNPNGFGGRVNYNYGPGRGRGTDFETVALHEIGHTCQLKHVADESDVMAYRIISGQDQRTLSTANISGAREVAALALTYDPPIVNCTGDFKKARNYVTFSEALSALPVTWAEFNATSRAKAVDLNWSTSSESENDFFTVERSADGISFRGIAEVPARNIVTGSVYEAVDEAPLPGLSYYRIAQTNFDGSQSASGIRQVNRSTAGELLLYPNPVVNQLTIVDADAEGNTQYDIYDGLGRKVFTTQSTGTPGRITVDVSELPSGQYVLQSTAGKMKRFVK